MVRNMYEAEILLSPVLSARSPVIGEIVYHSQQCLSSFLRLLLASLLY